MQVHGVDLQGRQMVLVAAKLFPSAVVTRERLLQYIACEGKRGHLKKLGTFAVKHMAGGQRAAF